MNNATNNKQGHKLVLETKLGEAKENLSEIIKLH